MALEKKLDEARKQIVMLRKSLLDAHNFIGDDVEAYETAKRRIDALAATADLSSSILCDAEAELWMDRDGCTILPCDVESQNEIPKHFTPLYKARKA